MFSFTVRRLIGAAAVVCLGASAVVVGSVAVPARTLALPGASESTVVMIEPTRVADTRYNIGLPSRIAAKAPRKMTVTGVIDTYIESTETTVIKQVVPAGATGVFLNVTVVAPGGPGFLAIRPGTATGVPATAGLNFGTETALANGILVALPATGNNAGQIDIFYGTPAVGVFTDVIIDVVGYTTASGLIDLVKRIEQLEKSGVAGETGVAGATGINGAKGDDGEQGEQGDPGKAGDKGEQGDDGSAGDKGDPGSAGDKGEQGVPGVSAVVPAQVVWVATSGGDYTKLSLALDSIIDADEDKPYVIKIAPGKYEETSPVALKDYVDVEGSGQDTTTITCACGGEDNDGSTATVSAGAINAEIRHLTVENTGIPGLNYSTAVYTKDVANESFSMLHVTATVTGKYVNGVRNESSSPSMNNVTANATGSSQSNAVDNLASSPSMNNVTATADSAGQAHGVYNGGASSPSMNNVTATGNGKDGYGVYNTAASSTLSMNNVTATGIVFGTTGQAHGVFNHSSKVSMNNVTATATGPAGQTKIGVSLQSVSTVSMNNVTATADSASYSSTGVQSSFRSTTTIRNSSITGITASIDSGKADSDYPVTVAYTVLDGALPGKLYKCLGVYDPALTPIICPQVDPQ
jgi:hypothetical protein